MTKKNTRLEKIVDTFAPITRCRGQHLHVAVLLYNCNKIKNMPIDDKLKIFDILIERLEIPEKDIEGFKMTLGILANLTEYDFIDLFNVKHRMASEATLNLDPTYYNFLHFNGEAL